MTCQEVSRAVASGEWSAGGWRQRLSIRFHLLMCRHCRRYARQIAALGSAARRALGKDRLDVASTERLRSSILDPMPGTDDDSDRGV